MLSAGEARFPHARSALSTRAKRAPCAARVNGSCPGRAAKLGVVGKGPDVRLSRWRPLLIAPAATQVVELCVPLDRLRRRLTTERGCGTPGFASRARRFGGGPGGCASRARRFGGGPSVPVSYTENHLATTADR